LKQKGFEKAWKMSKNLEIFAAVAYNKK